MKAKLKKALWYRQLDLWQFIEWLHVLATQWTDSQSASITAEFIKRLPRGKDTVLLGKTAHKLIMHVPLFSAMPVRTTPNGKQESNKKKKQLKPVSCSAGL